MQQKNSLDTKNRTKLDYKKLRLTDDCQYPSEEEETKTDMNKFSKYIAEEETDINDELFKKHSNFPLYDPVVWPKIYTKQIMERKTIN